VGVGSGERLGMRSWSGWSGGTGGTGGDLGIRVDLDFLSLNVSLFSSNGLDSIVIRFLFLSI